MSETTAIQWTESSWNPWHGCIKVSPGCKNCYMYRDKTRYGQDPMKVVRSKTKFNDPLKWKVPKLIFSCSWSDWFIEEADEWRDKAWGVIRATPQHTYQILTKRPERIPDHLPPNWGYGWPNVWLGVSVENSLYTPRIDRLKGIPAVTRFVSFEPIIGPLGHLGSLRGIHWAIFGGESGPNARNCDLTWIRDGMRQCREQGIKVFCKQLGSAAGLRDSHGGEMSEWPEDLRVREMPAMTPRGAREA